MEGFAEITMSVINDGTSPVFVSIGNESQNIPCTNNGYTSISMLIEIPFVGYVGLTQTPCTVSVGVLPSGITVGEIIDSTETTHGKIVLNVAKNSNLGGDNVLNGTVSLTFTISEKTIAKNFTWTKTKAGDPGQSGQNARLFSLDTSTYVIKKNTDETLTPSSIIFSSYYKDGESDTRNDYLGRFLISESTDGIKYSTKYTSAKDEQTVTYTPSSSSVSSIKCILCASGGITNELDSQTVVVLTDADGVNEKIKEITETISGVSSKVDAVNKSITDKVWQSDITNSINNYDNTTIKIIRDQQSKQETTIEGITSTVSDVQSKVEKKADGTTVQELSERVSTNEQTAEGFRQEVTKNYVTNDKLKDYPTNGQMKTAISESAKEINLSASKTYATKEENNQVRSDLTVRANEIEGKVTDNENNITEIIQTNKQIQQSVTDANNNITKLQQDSQSFKQEVEKTYMTKNSLDSLKIGGRNLLRNSNTLEFEDYYFVGRIEVYLTDQDGNYIVDEQNNTIILM